MDPPGGARRQGFGVGAEHGLQGLDDLALGGVYARAVEQVRHQVALPGGGLAQGGEGALDGGAVAARADGLHAVDLLALERRVDPQDLQLAVAALGVVVDADMIRSPVSYSRWSS